MAPMARSAGVTIRSKHAAHVENNGQALGCAPGNDGRGEEEESIGHEPHRKIL